MDSQSVLWAGVGYGGAPLPAGRDTFELENISQGEVTSTTPVDHYAMIREARLGDGSVDIVLDGGAVVAADDVRALRAPEVPAL